MDITPASIMEWSVSFHDILTFKINDAMTLRCMNNWVYPDLCTIAFSFLMSDVKAMTGRNKMSQCIKSRSPAWKKKIADGKDKSSLCNILPLLLFVH